MQRPQTGLSQNVAKKNLNTKQDLNKTVDFRSENRDKFVTSPSNSSMRKSAMRNSIASNLEEEDAVTELVPKSKTMNVGPAAKNMRESVMFLKLKKQKLAESILDSPSKKIATESKPAQGKRAS